MPLRQVLNGIVPLALLAGCSASTPVAGPPGPPTPSSTVPVSTGQPTAASSPATATATPTAAAPTPARTRSSCAPVGPTTSPFPATTAPHTGNPVGGPLGMQSISAGVHPGYDRVVFRLAGAAGGKPGWRVAYTAAPTSDGSGNPVAVAGTAYLEVIVRGVGYPQDTGVPDPAVKTLNPPCTKVVRQVKLDTVFEGQYTAFIGLSSVKPFRVFRLASPARLVVDVRHT